MVRERQSTRTYTESEALDLSVRNLTSEWRSEIGRLVERDKRTGHDVSVHISSSTLCYRPLRTVYCIYRVTALLEPTTVLV